MPDERRGEGGVEQSPELDFSHIARIEVPARPALYTAGYTGKKPVMLLKVAEHLDAVIADIRFRPFSRAPMWTKAAMERAWGTRYIHVRELGNRNYKGGEIEFVDLERGLRFVRSILLGDPVAEQRARSVILLCACPMVDRCHRWPAAEAIAERMGIPWRELTHEEIMGRPLESSNKRRGGGGRGGTGGRGGPDSIQTFMF